MAEHDHGLTGDAATLTQCPDEYWCVADDGWAQYFWREQTVTPAPPQAGICFLVEVSLPSNDVCARLAGGLGWVGT